MSNRLRWDLFCRVIDNYGDIGVCWRLACDLAARGRSVRLWVDDPSALAWMAPQGAPGVEIIHWTETAPMPAHGHAPTLPYPHAHAHAPEQAQPPADVVVEAFGCDPPAAYVAGMVSAAAAGRAPRWINLEYLSAEAYVERSHGLPSPQGNGLVKHFFFPGFTPRTGGLLREPGLLARRASFDGETRRDWLENLLKAQATTALHPTLQTGLQTGMQTNLISNPQPKPQPATKPAPQQRLADIKAPANAAKHRRQRGAEERVISVFCYAHANLRAALVPLMGDPAPPTLLLLTPGPAQQQLLHAPLPHGVRCAALPWLSQADFDRLLWSADLNVVRGEDSLVRAIWAGKPFIWHAYPQHDGAHGAKIEALLDALCAHADAPTAAALRSLWRSFNGLGTGIPTGAAPTACPGIQAWTQALQAWRAELATQPDLCNALFDFAQTPAP